MKPGLTLVKVGGNLIEDETALQQFVSIFNRINGPKVLVHGGGKVATKLAAKLGVKSELIEGRRITGDEMIDVVVMTYAGLVNKKIVALLQHEGTSAIGLTGADGNAIQASRRPVRNGIDYGWVGDVEHVNASLLRTLLSTQHTPVLCALTHDRKGNLLNTNADTIANEVAIALSEFYEVALNYCFEHSGVMRDLDDPGSLIPNIDYESYQQLKEQGIVSAGMIPKLDNAFEAIQKGVSKVNILNMNALNKLDNQNDHEYTTLR